MVLCNCLANKRRSGSKTLNETNAVQDNPRTKNYQASSSASMGSEKMNPKKPPQNLVLDKHPGRAFTDRQVLESTRSKRPNRGKLYKTGGMYGQKKPVTSRELTVEEDSYGTGAVPYLGGGTNKVYQQYYDDGQIKACERKIEGKPSTSRREYPLSTVPSSWYSGSSSKPSRSVAVRTYYNNTQVSDSDKNNQTQIPRQSGTSKKRYSLDTDANRDIQKMTHQGEKHTNQSISCTVQNEKIQPRISNKKASEESLNREHGNIRQNYGSTYSNNSATHQNYQYGESSTTNSHRYRVDQPLPMNRSGNLYDNDKVYTQMQSEQYMHNSGLIQSSVVKNENNICVKDPGYTQITSETNFQYDNNSIISNKKRNQPTVLNDILWKNSSVVREQNKHNQSEIGNPTKSQIVNQNYYTSEVPSKSSINQNYYISEVLSKSSTNQHYDTSTVPSKSSISSSSRIATDQITKQKHIEATTKPSEICENSNNLQLNNTYVQDYVKFSSNPFYKLQNNSEIKNQRHPQLMSPSLTNNMANKASSSRELTLTLGCNSKQEFNDQQPDVLPSNSSRYKTEKTIALTNDDFKCAIRRDNNFQDSIKFIDSDVEDNNDTQHEVECFDQTMTYAGDDGGSKSNESYIDRHNTQQAKQENTHKLVAEESDSSHQLAIVTKNNRQSECITSDNFETDPKSVGLYKDIKDLYVKAMDYRFYVDRFFGTPADTGYYFIEENLTRILFKLDKLDVEYSDFLRGQRKIVIKYIYGLLEELEEKAAHPNGPTVEYATEVLTNWNM